MRGSADVREPRDENSDSSRDSSCYEIPNPSPVIPVYEEISSDSEMTNDEEDLAEDDLATDPEFTPETYKVSRDKRDNVNF